MGSNAKEFPPSRSSCSPNKYSNLKRPHSSHIRLLRPLLRILSDPHRINRISHPLNVPCQGAVHFRLNLEVRMVILFCHFMIFQENYRSI